MQKKEWQWRQAMSNEDIRIEKKLASIHAMLHPKTIAILGATDRMQYGGRFLNNLITTGCQSKLYPVNPKKDEIFGVKTYHTILEVPEPVDLAVIIIPGPAVADALRECAKMGAKSALIISAGFAELGTEKGKARQAELQAVARETGVRVCGPNCLGLANVVNNIWATAVRKIPVGTQALKSNMALVSQSGATCFGPLMTTARDRNVGFRYIISSGNEADLEASDYIQYMLRDPEIDVVAALVEGFKDGAQFAVVADKALELGKRIVLLKVGRSAVGAKAASSHTAAMTGSDVVQDALFKQKGVIRVDDYDELIETANLFLKAKPPKGNRVGVVSHSGGIGSLLADKIGEQGLEMPLLSQKTAEGIGVILGERGSAANPADVTGFASGDSFPSILQLLLSDENIDIQVVASTGRGVQTPSILKAVEEQDKPIVYLWTGSFKATDSLPLLQEGNVPVFYMPGKCAKGIRRLVDYYRTRGGVLAEKASGAGDMPAFSAEALTRLKERMSAAGKLPLNEYDSKRVLSLFGISVTGEVLCPSAEEAARAAAKVGYPVALKVVSQQITHKTDAGGVRLGIAGPEALATAYEEMLAHVKSRNPEAKIDGVLVQQMVKGGIEVIVGVSRDAQFGPVLMLGLGGVLVEAMGAASWRVCPIGPRDAREMIGEVRGLSKILAGYRGSPKADLDSLADTLVKVSRLAIWAGDEISSLDINPLAVLPDGKGVLALDALILPGR
jgi:acetate---CoA ligase (ADP-forming)